MRLVDEEATRETARTSSVTAYDPAPQDSVPRKLQDTAYMNDMLLMRVTDGASLNMGAVRLSVPSNSGAPKTVDEGVCVIETVIDCEGVAVEVAVRLLVSERVCDIV